MVSMVGRLSLESLFESTSEECLDKVGNGQVHYGKAGTIIGSVGLY